MILFYQGFALGLSMALPGVSGGTMAFVLGIYEKLIKDLSALSIKLWRGKSWLRNFLAKLLRRLLSGPSSEKLATTGSVKELSKNQQILKRQGLFKNNKGELFKKQLAFWLPLMMGCGLALLSFVFLAPSFIEKYSLEFYSLMFGLIGGSALVPIKEMKKGGGKNWGLLFISLSLSLALFWAAEAKLSFASFKTSARAAEPLALLLAGGLSGMALVIPGLSGSSLLLIFGLYESVLQTFKSLKILPALCFGLGIFAGLFALSGWIRSQLERRLDESRAVIAGLLGAGLAVVFPLSRADFLPADALLDLWLDPQSSFWIHLFLFAGLESLAKSYSSILVFLLYALVGFVAFIWFSRRRGT